MSDDLAGWAFVALGSNEGDSRRALAAAIEFLEQLSDFPIRKSSLWETAPVDCPSSSPYFLNAVVALRPRAGETPESLLRQLLQHECKVGRSPANGANAPRSIDLDLIAFGSERSHTTALTLPHPRAAHRRFVLEPLAELAPEFVLPGESRNVMQLLAAVRPSQAARLVL